MIKNKIQHLTKIKLVDYKMKLLVKKVLVDIITNGQKNHLKFITEEKE